MTIEIPRISVVVLTWSRPEEIRKNVLELIGLKRTNLELIVVDNASPEPVVDILPNDPRLQVISLPENIGVGGRNAGINAASGDIVITLDDDVRGLTDKTLDNITNEFSSTDIAAVNFSVLDELTGEITNWCHHRRRDEYAARRFETYEISEGAVAFRRAAVIEAGLYPEYFFISHEGPDLALRLMDLGYQVIYSPNIVVRHSHCQVARTTWRRYYYDTRNLVWFVVRTLPLLVGARKLLINLGAMCVYSLRDGFFRYWLKGLYDAMAGLPRALSDRHAISRQTLRRYLAIERHHPGFIYMLKQRLSKRHVRI